MTNDRLYAFVAGPSGPWTIERQTTIAGEPLPTAPRLDIIHSPAPSSPAPQAAPGAAPGSAWSLRGFTSNGRYTSRAEQARLEAVQAPLGRPEATRAALIPIRKSPAWWAMTQDERRAIFEERSRHIADTMRFLPAISRRLHHSRDLGEPFDFLTWFEFAPEHAAAFDELVALLRATEEWRFVDREVDIRLARHE